MPRFIASGCLLLLLTACHTPIALIGFPEPTVIHGQIAELTDDGFVLQDESGRIEVEVEDFPIEGRLQAGEYVTVKGVLDEDGSVGKTYVMAEEFDAYSIIKQDGTEILIVPYKSVNR